MSDIPPLSEQNAHRTAAALGVDARTLARWSDAGLLTPTRTKGGHRRYDADKVKALKLGDDFTLTVGEVATILGVDPKTVARFADDKRLACRTTPGGHRRFRKMDVEALRRRRQHAHTRPGGTTT